MEPEKYICSDINDLGRPLGSSLKRRFQELFYDFDGHDQPIQKEAAWRMFYMGLKPETCLARYGIDFDRPTVRDAVAFDLVKLDVPSVSNLPDYTSGEHIGYSIHEYERYLLNRNFRIHLVNLEPEFSNITYSKMKDADGNIPSERKRTVDCMYQGVKMSDSLLGYFESVFNECVDGGNGTVKQNWSVDDLYVPFTNANDFTTETALVPNTHPDFRPITARAYYDRKYIQYHGRLDHFGIRSISTFALVDEAPGKGKNHVGRYLVKVQRLLDNGRYAYITAEIDKDGQFAADMNGVPLIDVWDSDENTILCVCREDFSKDGRPPASLDEWEPETGDVRIEKSTTSSRYSVFEQRVPDYDLKQVRHYFQFKTRLEGMELCLEQLRRDINRKEIQSSECFAKQTMCIQRLFQEFAENEKLMKLVSQYYELMSEWDKLTTKKYQIQDMKDEKEELLQRLIDEYNALGRDSSGNPLSESVDRNMGKKIELGQKISSLKLEIGRSIGASMEAIEDRKQEIIKEVEDINEEIRGIGSERKITMNDDQAAAFKGAVDPNSDGSLLKKAKNDYRKKSEDAMDEIEEHSDVKVGANGKTSEVQTSMANGEDETLKKIKFLQDGGSTDSQVMTTRETKTEPDPLASYDTTRLHGLILQTEKWRNYMFAIGYELSQMKKMLTPAEDKTIMVRRLVHNFEVKMRDIENQVWDDHHMLKKGFSFTGISTAGLQEIILLHDWYATNAPGKTFQEMGFRSENDFMEFRKRCNRISYNLRKNQYAKSLRMKIERLDDSIKALQDQLADRQKLKFKDKYGWEAKKEEEERDRQEEQKRKERDSKGGKIALPIAEEADTWKPDPSLQAELDGTVEKRKSGLANLPEWNLGMVTPGQAKAVSPFAKVEELLKKQEISERQYADDLKRLESRVVEYLKGIGLIEDETGIEKLATRNKLSKFDGDIGAEISTLEKWKGELDFAVGTMQKQRSSLQSILDRVYQVELEIQKLQDENRRIFNKCVAESNRQIRNRLLLNKLDNENRIIELKDAIRKAKSGHLREFNQLERMRKDVDRRQEEYDRKVKEFKENIGLDSETMANLMVGIYNRYQDEILEHSERKNT